MVKGIQGIQNIKGIIKTPNIPSVDLEKQWKKKVASVELKLQILSENCNFSPVDSVAVSDTEIVILGRFDSGVVNSRIGGLSVTNYNSNYALIKYNISTKSVSWIYTDSTTFDQITVYNKIRVSSDKLFVFYTVKYLGTVKQMKVSVSTGVADDSLAITGAYNDTKNMCNSCIDSSDNNYIIYAGYGEVKVVKTSDFSAYSTVSIPISTDLDEWRPFFIETDETYLYCGFTAKVDGVYAGNIYTIPISTFSSPSLFATFKSYDGSTPVVANMHGLSESIVASIGDYYTVPGWSSWISDGTIKNSITEIQSRLKNVDNLLFAYHGTVVTKLNTSTFGTLYAKDYSADVISSVSNIVKLGSNYYLIATTEGDFDGDHSGNTNKCAVITTIDISNGNI